MTLYKRNWNCALCNSPVIWDSERHTLTCKCKKQHNFTFVNMTAFTPIPKYARHLTEKLTVKLDSVAYICPNCGKYIISDQSKGENPQLHISFIKYPREDDRLQGRMAWTGKQHTETLSYNIKPVENWRENGWLALNENTCEQLAQFLNWRNPAKLESWM